MSVADHLKARIRRSSFEKEGFSCKELVESVTKSVAFQATLRGDSAVNGALDASDYRATFARMLQLVSRLRSSVESELADSCSLAVRREKELKCSVLVFQSDLGAVMRDFRSLDTAISKVSQTAVHIGDRLQSIEKQKESIAASKTLVQHFIAFNRGSADLIDAVFSADSGSRLYSAADLILELRRVAAEMASRDVVSAQQLIARVFEDTLQRLRDELRAAIPRRDAESMRQCVIRLEKMYAQKSRADDSKMSQWDAVVDSLIVNEYLRGQVNWQKCRPLLGTFEGSRKALDVMVTDVTHCLLRAADSLVLVFPNALPVVCKKLVIEQLSPFVEECLAAVKPKALDADASAYVNTLQTLFVGLSAMCEQMVDTCKALAVDVPKDTSSLMHSLFAAHIGGETKAPYFIWERRQLRSQMRQVVEQLLVRALGAEESADKRKWRKAQDSTAARSALRTALQSGLPELIVRVLKAAEASVKRCFQVSRSGLLVSELLTDLLDTLQRVVLTHLPLRATLPAAAPREAVACFLFLDALKALNSAIQLLNWRFFQVIESRLSAPEMAHFLHHCRQLKARRLALLERHLQSGLTHFVDSCVAWLKRLLSKQRKTDYRPKDDMASMTQTPVCKSVCDFVATVGIQFNKALDGKNLDRVLFYWGSCFYAQVLAHLKKLSVSALGSMQVNLDVKSYQKAAAALRVAKVSDSFLTLVQRVQLLGMPPLSVCECVQRDKALRKDIRALDQWLQLRLDYKSEIRPLLAQFL